VILGEEFNRGLRAIESKNYSKAALLFKKCLRAQEFKEAWLNLGVAYKWLNNYKGVKECFTKAADPRVPMSDGKYLPMYDIALNNLGLYHYGIEQDDAAIACYDEVLSYGIHYEALWNKSIALLRKYCSGHNVDLAEAWKLYNNRFTRVNADVLRNDKPGLILWDFKPKPGEKLVVMSEQGAGDVLMFARYLPYVASMFESIDVMCPADMASLFKYNTVRSAKESTARYGIPIASIARILNHIPSGEWLNPDSYQGNPSIIADCSKAITGTGGYLCVWHGSTAHVNNINRQIPPGFLDKIKGNKYSYIARKGYTKLDIVDWHTTIKQLSLVDAVITVDTSIAHLCGSLGKLCYVLMPLRDTDFRWGDSTNGLHNPWYPSVKVIRNPNDWGKVIERLNNELVSKT
jgi:tetratricopeptide (TPR) repeat protein